MAALVNNGTFRGKVSISEVSQRHTFHCSPDAHDSDRRKRGRTLESVTETSNMNALDAR